MSGSAAVATVQKHRLNTNKTVRFLTVFPPFVTRKSQRPAFVEAAGKGKILKFIDAGAANVR
jgi:hypothetical protein